MVGNSHNLMSLQQIVLEQRDIHTANKTCNPGLCLDYLIQKKIKMNKGLKIKLKSTKLLEENK